MEIEMIIYMIIIGLVALAVGFRIGHIGILASEKQQHNIGERIVQETVKENLPADKYFLMNNITLKMPDDTTTQIDHVLVSRYGLFIIETKHCFGKVVGNVNDKKWAQITKFDKRYFQNPIRQNHKHVKAIEALFPTFNKKAIESLIVFTGEALLEGDMSNKVRREYEIPNHIKGFKHEYLTKDDVEIVIGRLTQTRLEESEETDASHLEGLRKRHN